MNKIAYETTLTRARRLGHIAKHDPALLRKEDADAFYLNRKPYRTKLNKGRAYSQAKQSMDGVWRCHTVPVEYHRN